MARTGKRYRNQLAAETRTHAQEFANISFLQNINQWIPYDNERQAKLIFVNGSAQVHFRPYPVVRAPTVVRTHRTQRAAQADQPISTHSTTYFQGNYNLRPRRKYLLVIGLSNTSLGPLLIFLLLFTSFSLPVFLRILCNITDYLFLRN